MSKLGNAISAVVHVNTTGGQSECNRATKTLPFSY
jgi:hypothetical protein